MREIARSRAPRARERENSYLFGNNCLYMQKDGEIEALLKEHEELIGLYTHESKIKWNLISVYVALNVGLVSAVVVLIQNKTIERIEAVSFLCLMGSLFSFATALMFKRNRYRISEWVREGIKVEKVLMEKASTLELFKICESFLEKQIKILYGMLILAIFWLLVAIGMTLVGMGLLSLGFFP